MPRAPLYVTPHIAGGLMCNQGNANPALTTVEEILDWCVQNDGINDLAVKALLERIEPGGAAGKVQLGYTLQVPLLELYVKRGENWEIDESRASRYMEAIRNIGRPVVIYLMGDHFDSGSKLSHQLAEDPRNLLAYANGPAQREGYWGNGIIPFTLRADESIPVNRYRFNALRHMSQQIAALDASTRNLVVGIALAGELHQQYPGFENGVGEYDNIRITDYRPESQQEFRDWLKAKYDSVDRLNRQFGFEFPSFDAIEAPARNIRRDKLQSFAQHFDAYAGGTLPVFGWLWDPKRKIQSLELFVDGKSQGPVAYGLGRMDVYRAKPEITATHTGFRHDVDFRKLNTGKHIVQIVALSGGHRYLVGQQEFMIVPRDQSSTANQPEPGKLQGLEDAGKLDGVQFWLDRPSALQDVYFNPLAREWNLFREHQVYQLLNRFYRIAREAGIPPKLLYSHQIVPDVNGAWNPVLFASDSSISNVTPWRAGINFYGDSPLIFDYIKKKNLRNNYGVPEFNPQQWKKPEAAYDAFVNHYLAGARFVSPFYLSVIPERLFKPGEPRTFDIAPNNPFEGSDKLYETLKTFVRK